MAGRSYKSKARVNLHCSAQQSRAYSRYLRILCSSYDESSKHSENNIKGTKNIELE
jgi:hypothetical protein